MSKLACGQLELNPAGDSLRNPMGFRIIPLEDRESVMLTILHFRLNLTEAEQDSTVPKKASAEKKLS